MIIDEYLNHGTDWRAGYETALFNLLDEYHGESIPKTAIRNLIDNLHEAEGEE